MLSLFTGCVSIAFLLLLLSSPCFPARTTPTFDLKRTNYFVPHRFDRLVGVSKGSNIHGVSELKKYFHRFGYLTRETKKSASFTDLFDDHFEQALTKYQANLGLQVTGKLDGETISLIKSPRCGVPDVAVPPRNADAAMHVKRKDAVFTNVTRWNRELPMTLTYAFSPENTITTLTGEEIRAAIKNAFGHWEKVVPVTFLETTDYGFADIKIGFYGGDHGDGSPFDGMLGVWAHSSLPESGMFELDAAETWSVNFKRQKSDVAVDLESVATHEIGHLLGLWHTSVKEDIMYPFLRSREKKVKLHLDDIKAIQELYGYNPNFSYKDFSETDHESSNGGYEFKNKPSSSHWFTILLLPFILWFCM